MKFQTKPAFTAVEIMITLFVAVMFIFSGYSLYLHVYQKINFAKNRSIASNIAEAHLKKRMLESELADCLLPLDQRTKTELPEGGEDLPGLTIETVVSCPYGNTVELLEVTSTVKYMVNGSEELERQTIYVEK